MPYLVIKWLKDGLIIALISSVVIACQSDQSGWVEHDLMSEGLPVKIMGPAELDVKQVSFAAAQEYQITAEDGYAMNAYVMDADVGDPKLVTQRLRELVARGPYVGEMTLEQPTGFVYEINIDSSHMVYGFRKVVIQGAKQIIFQNPTMSRLNKEQALALFDAAP